jgi:uncharacterized repeat protein (TIGR01451 family)
VTQCQSLDARERDSDPRILLRTYVVYQTEWKEMIYRVSRFLITLVAFGFAAGSAFGQSSVNVELTHQRIVTGADGRERAEVAASALPGDVIEYTVRYRNLDKGSITGVNLTLPVPLGLAFLPGSAKPTSLTASLDGKAFSSVPLKRVVRDKSGLEREVNVPYSEYRFLGWSVKELAAGAGGVLTARMRMEPVVTASSQANAVGAK